MSGTIGLYATYGEHRQRHKLVLYFRHDKDWTRKQRVAQGSTGKPLCVCQMTDVAESLCKTNHPRATLLAYGHNLAPDVNSLRTDLEILKLNPSDFNLFCEKALPYLS